MGASQMQVGVDRQTAGWAVILVIDQQAFKQMVAEFLIMHSCILSGYRLRQSSPRKLMQPKETMS